MDELFFSSLLERQLKTSFVKKVSGKTDRAATTKNIGNNVITIMRIGGRNYAWISGNKMISIEYSDSHFQYSEPLEVLNAYLNKYPSTLPETYETKKRDKEWIKEELDYQLWVADRWVSLIQQDDPKRDDKLEGAARHLEKFARYSSAYFKPLFGDPMKDDVELLQSAYQSPNLETIVRAKLAEYKEWWAEHKSESISLP